MKPDLVDILIRYRYTDGAVFHDRSLNKFPWNKHWLTAHISADLLRTDDGPRETARAPEDTVQLFIQADFFLLAPLCATLLRRLEEQFCQSVMEHFCFDLKGPKNVDGLIRARLCPKRVSERSLPGLLEDLHNAIRLAYSIRTARDLHKTIIAFTLCLRDRMNIADLQDVLSDVPQFQVDLHKVTLALFFDREFMSEAGSKSVNQKAVDLFEAAENVCSKPICETVFKAGGSLVLNPFPDADERWCKQCAQECFACLVHDLVLMMPLD